MTGDEIGWRLLVEDDPFANHIGPIYINSDSVHVAARLRFRVERQHCNKMGYCHGGMLATFLDISLGTVAVMLSRQSKAKPTIHLTVDYLRPALEGVWITCDARLVHQSRRMLFVDGILSDSEGPVARANAIFKSSGSENEMGSQALATYDAVT